MAAPSGQIKPSRYFIPLALLLVVLYSAVLFFGNSAAPKLGLDLQGGTSQTLSANTVAGGPPVNSENLGIARDIINQRVDSLGVAEADVVVQGHDIVVSMPGKVDPSKLSSLSTQAKLEFRTVLQGVADVPAAPAPSPSASASPAPSASASAPAGAKASSTPSAASSPSTAPSAAASPSAGAAAAPSAAPSASSTVAPDTAATGQGISTLAEVKAKVGADAYNTATTLAQPLLTNPTSAPATPTAAQAAALAPFGPIGKGLPGKLTPADVAALPPTIQFAVPNITCAQLNGRIPGVITTSTAVNSEVVACDPNGASTGLNKYLLDAAKVHGEDVSSASANLDTGGQGQAALGWVVNLSFKGSGQSAWTALTKQLYAQADPTNNSYRQVAIVLDNTVVTAPQILSVIPGPATISGGSLDQDSAKLLATQLKFGALPISFTPQDTQTVSASLGLAQLKAGLLAGGIGLALVVLYCLFYYRGLGLVVIASLMVSAALIYAAIVLLGRSQLSFTLSLAGVAGFIVAIGITADSFVVFFERLKDEVRDGRSGRSAVPKAWSRARRTILSADAVSIIAAVSLVIFATGPVSGFAFTLGLSTIIDLVVVFLFTHPLVSVLSGSKAFTSPRFSGLGDMRSAHRIDGAAPRLATKES